jgi:DNA polymerase-3 subunit epsilon
VRAAGTRFALVFGAALGLVGGGIMALALALWSALDTGERAALQALLGRNAILLFLVALLVAAALGGLARLVHARWPGTASKLAEQARLMHTVNPAHRLAEDAGAPELRMLAHEVNAIAAAHEAARADIQTRITAAGQRLAQESGRLAALMAELPQAVLVCNAEGRILLYNARAARLFDDGGDDTPVGLGRSVYGLLDRALIDHALQRVAQRLGEEAAHFVALRAGAWLRARLVPVLNSQERLDGFVLMLDDVTRSVVAEGARERLLRQLTEESRAGLANIRAAAEALQRHPDIDDTRRQRFTDVIGEEARRLSERLDAAAQAPAPLRAPWPLEDMRAADLAQALQASLDAAGLSARIGAPVEPGLWLSVDSHGLVRALTRFVLGHGLPAPGLEIAADAGHALLTLRWPGAAPRVRDDAALDELLARHGGEWWCVHDAPTASSRLCVQLPLAEAAEGAVLHNRPVYYDFDLFHQPGQTPALDARRLSELTYTVFDTETTGLNPGAGDEIISIGALRIVNGRLLENERFARLVDPRRAVSPTSQQVHGITPQMLAGQPGIEQVLPAFHRFAEDTVLVAHNAAFDMRFLQLKEAASGVRFDQPVLDTLLLSALVHPGHADAEHRLEAIAERLGVPVVARHTALGDALVTGQVLLKMIPLLAERGIHTLGEAREASRRTVYAKLDY